MTTGTILAGQDRRACTASLQAYVTSLTYLRQEARRDGLEPIADIIWNAVAAIENWLNDPEAPIECHRLIDSSLCHSLEFMLKWLALSPAKREQIAHFIGDREAAEPGRAKPAGKASVSRRTAV